jgi:hypothetical protein
MGELEGLMLLESVCLVLARGRFGLISDAFLEDLRSCWWFEKPQV